MPKLQEHLLSRVVHPEWTGDGNEFTPEERSKLILRNDRIYRHKILRINYTTYDVRRGQDSLNPRTHSDVMFLSPEGDTSHQFSYAQIIGVFHADVLHNVTGASIAPQRMEFLWVRRYQLDSTWRGGFKRKRLHRLEFLPADDPDAFGFLNPDEVIRGAHVIPAFARGTTTEFLSADSIGRLPREGLEEEEDWKSYYLNLYGFSRLAPYFMSNVPHSFVDRDMVMRYVGGGVGHHKVDIPPDKPDPAPAPREDSDDEEEFPANILIPEPVVPAVPIAPPQDPAGRVVVSNPDEERSDSEDEDGPELSDGPDDDGDEDSADAPPDLGPEDGHGGVPEEVIEGYAPL